MLEPVSDEPVAMGPEGKWDPAQPAPECGAQLRLVGAVVNPTRPEWSFAAIAAEEGKTMLYRQGSNVDGSYVLAVRPSSVVMQPESGGACELMMFRESTEEPAPAPKPAQAARRPSRATNDRNAGLTTEQLEQGIQKVSDTQFNIQRSVIDTILANQGSIMKTARVIPHEENGRVVGMKLYGIRRDSLLGKLGIRNGDMLRTINGFDMTSPDSALQAYSRLRTASELSLAVKRQSKEMNIEYNIQ